MKTSPVQGAWKTWLSPIQARIISFTAKNKKAAERIAQQLVEAGIRIDTDLKDETVNNKVRNAELVKIPYIIVIGDREEKAKTLAVRKRGSKKITSIKINKFIKDIKKEIEERT